MNRVQLRRGVAHLLKSASALSTALELGEGIIEGEAPDSLLTFPKQSKTPLMTDMLHKKKEANETMWSL